MYIYCIHLYIYVQFSFKMLAWLNADNEMRITDVDFNVCGQCLKSRIMLRLYSGLPTSDMCPDNSP